MARTKKSPKKTLKAVAQKLVTSESFRAKKASGALSADQKLPSPLLVPKIKIDASGSSTSGSMMKSSVPTLKGRTTSNPRTCLNVAILELI